MSFLSSSRAWPFHYIDCVNQSKCWFDKIIYSKNIIGLSPCKNRFSGLTLYSHSENIVRIAYHGKDQKIGQALVGYYSQRLLLKAKEGLSRSKNRASKSMIPKLMGSMATRFHIGSEREGLYLLQPDKAENRSRKPDSL